MRKHHLQTEEEHQIPKAVVLYLDQLHCKNESIKSNVQISTTIHFREIPGIIQNPLVRKTIQRCLLVLTTLPASNIDALFI